MDTILQGLQALDGVLGVAAIDPTGQIVGYKAHSVYDYSLLQQVSRIVANAIDSIQLLHDDWESVTTTFSDGRLLLRNLGSGPSRAKGSLLALLVIADGRLNLSFAGVAIRVAVAKLKNLTAAQAAGVSVSNLQPGLQGSGLHGSGLHGSHPAMSAPGFGPQGMGIAAHSAAGMGLPQGAAPQGSSFTMGQQPNMGVPKLEVATSGLSWSGLGGSSTMAASGVAVADTNSAAYLTTVTKALAKCVGPMAKAFVKEAICKLWPNRPFSRELGPALVADLERHIEDKDDLTQFRSKTKSA